MAHLPCFFPFPTLTPPYLVAICPDLSPLSSLGFPQVPTINWETPAAKLTSSQKFMCTHHAAISLWNSYGKDRERSVLCGRWCQCSSIDSRRPGYDCGFPQALPDRGRTAGGNNVLRKSRISVDIPYPGPSLPFCAKRI